MIKKKKEKKKIICFQTNSKQHKLSNKTAIFTIRLKVSQQLKINLYVLYDFRCSSKLPSALFHHDLLNRDMSFTPFPALETVKT